MENTNTTVLYLKFHYVINVLFFILSVRKENKKNSRTKQLLQHYIFMIIIGREAINSITLDPKAYSGFSL